MPELLYASDMEDTTMINGRQSPVIDAAELTSQFGKDVSRANGSLPT